MPQTMHSCELPEKYINQLFQLHCIYLQSLVQSMVTVLMMDCEGIKWKT